MTLFTPPVEDPSAEERRTYGRYRLPIPILVEARWNGNVLPLSQAPGYEDISAVGLRFCLAGGPEPPVGSTLDIGVRLLKRPLHPTLVDARCRGRVLRHDGPGHVVVLLEDVDFLRHEPATGLPATTVRRIKQAEFTFLLISTTLSAISAHTEGDQ